MSVVGGDVEVHTRIEHGETLPFVLWRFARPMRVVSSAPVGGGFGVRSWVLNAQVPSDFANTNLEAHIDKLATLVGINTVLDLGVGLLTAADVAAGFEATEAGVMVRASVGVRQPVWAAAPAADDFDESTEEIVTVAHAPAGIAIGTINIVAFVPVPMTESALVNLATTATEAKTQALYDAGIDGTGTVTDAIVIVSPRLSAVPDHSLEPFGGPRSTWGARVARAVHGAVLAGAQHSQKIVAAEDADAADPASRDVVATTDP